MLLVAHTKMRMYIRRKHFMYVVHVRVYDVECLCSRVINCHNFRKPYTVFVTAGSSQCFAGCIPAYTIHYIYDIIFVEIEYEDPRLPFNFVHIGHECDKFLFTATTISRATDSTCELGPVPKNSHIVTNESTNEDNLCTYFYSVCAPKCALVDCTCYMYLSYKHAPQT
jgi:hypothetical protein